MDPALRQLVRERAGARCEYCFEHFRQDGPRISGKTPTGRVTASLLKMNDSQRLEIRALILGL
jgi:hypothetical protein